MKFTLKTSIPHGVTPQDATGPFTPASVTVTLRDYSTDTVPVSAVYDDYKLQLDFSGKDYRPEDVISIAERDSCPSASGSTSAP